VDEAFSRSHQGAPLFREERTISRVVGVENFLPAKRSTLRAGKRPASSTGQLDVRGGAVLHPVRYRPSRAGQGPVDEPVPVFVETLT